MTISTTTVWSEQGIGFPGEIDVRAEVAACLADHGHWALLRKSRTQYSPSWNHSRREARHSDEFNVGSGHMYDDFFVKIRKVPTIDMQAGPGREVRSALGLMAPRRYVVYLKHPPVDGFDIVPTLNDQILEITLDETTQQPELAFNIERIYDIHQTHDYRDQNGRVEYWSLLVQQQVIGK